MASRGNAHGIRPVFLFREDCEDSSKKVTVALMSGKTRFIQVVDANLYGNGGFRPISRGDNLPHSAVIDLTRNGFQADMNGLIEAHRIEKGFRDLGFNL